MTMLDPDNVFIALLIAAMTASGHVSAKEAERAQHIIWSMRRFRHRSGEAVGRRIERMRTLDGTLGGPIPRGLAADLGLDRQDAKSILDVMRIKSPADGEPNRRRH